MLWNSTTPNTNPSYGTSTLSHLHGIHVGFAKDRDFQYLEEYVPAVGDKLIAGEEAQTERLLITSTVFLMMSSMRNSLYDELYQIKDTKTEEKNLL